MSRRPLLCCASIQIFYVNHSVNFFLYCITGRRFRAALRVVCCSTDVETLAEARRRIADNPRLVAAAAVGVALPHDGGLSSTGVKHSSSTVGGLVRSRSADLDPKSITMAADKGPRTRSF